MGTNTDFRMGRREFLAGAALGTAMAHMATQTVRAIPTKVDPHEPQTGGLPDPEKPIGLGIIGAGNMGFAHMRQMWEAQGPNQSIVFRAISECYKRRERQVVNWARDAMGISVDAYSDYQDLLARDDIDAVIVATPDHWHALNTIHALEAGKDVYCEKPLCLTAEEAVAIRDAVYRTGRVFACGVQGCSNPAFRRARQLIDEGAIGDLVWGQTCAARNTGHTTDPQAGEWNYHIDPDATDDPEAGDAYIDWQQWLGPAPDRPFSPPRFFQFRKFWDYSGGIATDLIFHSMAPFVLALGLPAPERATASGGIYIQQDDREVPDTFMTTLEFPQNFTMVIPSSTANAHGIPPVIRGNRATMHFGGWGHIRLAPEPGFQDWFEQRFGTQELHIDAAADEGLPPPPNPYVHHFTNWFECIRSRKTTFCPVEVAMDTMIAMKMAVEAYRQDTVIYWDNDAQEYIDSHPRPNRRSKYPPSEA